MTYATKVDWWLALLVAAAVASGPVIGFVTAPNPEEGLRVALYVAIFALSALAVIFLLAWPVHYQMQERELVVRSGLLRWKIPYERITRVRRTRKPLSSPAWSLDRLQIDWGGDTILISPKDQERFPDDLAARTGLERRGMEWVRATLPG